MLDKFFNYFLAFTVIFSAFQTASALVAFNSINAPMTNAVRVLAKN
jgi:hypothetical protein